MLWGRAKHTDMYERTKMEVRNLSNRLMGKLDPWLFIDAGPPFEVTRFDGKPIRYQGVKFTGSPRDVFWGGFIEPFLEDGIINVLDKTAGRCRDANLKPTAYLDEAADRLQGLVRGTYDHMAGIDQRLMNKGGLRSAGRRDVTGKIVRMEQVIDGQLKATQLSAMSAWRQNRRWSDTTKWIMGVVATVIGILLLVFKDWWW